ncbi:NrdH-like redox domain-containing protein [Geomonas sp. Red276]
MRIRLLAAVVTAALAVPLVAQGEMYKWVDDNGVVTFKDYPPPASKKKKRKVKTYSDSDFDPAPAHAPAPAPQPPASAHPVQAAAPVRKLSPTPAASHRFTGTVEMYVTSWCGYCKKARRYLDSKGIPYVAYDVEKDSAAAQRHRELGGRGVPLIVIGSKTLSGFSEQAIDYYLENSM